MKDLPLPSPPPSPTTPPKRESVSAKSEPLFPSSSFKWRPRSLEGWGGRWVMFVRDYSWQLHWSVRSVRSPRGLGLWLLRISRGLQAAVQTVQRRQAQLMCVGRGGGCKRAGPQSQTGLIFTRNSRKICFFPPPCTLFPCTAWQRAAF